MKRPLAGFFCSILLFARIAAADPSTSVSAETGDVSDISGWSLAAEARCGSNGNDNLPWPDFDLIDPDWNGDGGYITWDPTCNPGFQAGPVNVHFVADLANGTATFSITDSGNNTYTTYYSGLSGTVQKILIRAAVENSAFAGWIGPTVAFYKDGSFVECTSFAQAPQVDTTSTPYAAAAETLTVTPSDSTFDKVEVIGQFEMDSSDPDPSPNDLFGQIFLFKN